MPFVPFDPDSADFGDDEDVYSRMKDISLAAVSSDDAVIGEIVARKGIQATGEILDDLLEHIQHALQPLGSYPGGVISSAVFSEQDVLTTLTNPEVLKKAWVTYVIYDIFEEGETRLRFKYEDAGKVIADSLKEWERKKVTAFEQAWKRCAFDLNKDGIITILERGFTQRSSSVRVTL